MSKKVFLAIFLVLISFCAFSQTLDPIIDDLSVFFDELGKEMAPLTLQNELSGCGMNAADFNDKKLFFISASLGANLSYGLLRFVDEGNTNFNTLNVYNFVNTILSDSPDFVQDMYSLSKSFFPYLNLRLCVGFNFFFDTDVIMLFSIFPQVLTDAIAGSAEVEDLTMSSLNMGFRIRKTLIKDSGAFPAISLGIGYTYADFHAGYTIPEYTQDISGDNLIIRGDLYLDSVIHAAGVDLAISKVLGFFVPFFKISSYYQWTNFSSGMSSFHARLEDTVGTLLIPEVTDGPDAVNSIYEISVILNTGFELRMGGFVLTPYTTFDISTKTFTANLEMRTEI